MGVGVSGGRTLFENKKPTIVKAIREVAMFDPVTIKIIKSAEGGDGTNLREFTIGNIGNAVGAAARVASFRNNFAKLFSKCP